MNLQKRVAFLFLNLHFYARAVPQDDSIIQHVCLSGGNYTQNSTYQKNLNTILSSLSENVDEYGFYNASIGQDSDRVSAVVLCRGDVELNLCRGCVKDAARKIVQQCPDRKVAYGWYVKCLIYFSNENIIGSMSSDTLSLPCNNQNATQPAKFNQDLRSMLDRLLSEATQGGPFLKFAAGNTSAPDLNTIYALVQCTPDLSAQGCSDCLTAAFGALSAAQCVDRVGAIVLTRSCNFRYENYRFFNYTLIEPPLPLPQSGKDDRTIPTVVIILVPIAVVLMLLAICNFVVLTKRQKQKAKKGVKTMEDTSSLCEIKSVESLQYDLDTIRAATNNFSEANKLGQGGFGVVYKGQLADGIEIAVKRLSGNSQQGDLEFKNEVVLVARLHHRNLVRLHGFCLEGRERILVYEFVPNGSLDKLLFGKYFFTTYLQRPVMEYLNHTFSIKLCNLHADPIKRGCLNWERRYKIIIGIAKGLVYMHEDSRLRIIHRDLKANNILLDGNMNPKIGDFGMARLFALDETQGSTSRVVGTYGYMAPEYAMHGHFSTKSDVFSFGVLVLEIVTGRRNTSFRYEESAQDLLSYVWIQWQNWTASTVIDQMLRGVSSPVHEIMKCIHIGLLCVQDNVADRPTMGEIVLMLSSSSLSLAVPSRPAFFVHNIITAGTVDNTEASRNEVSCTEFYPR
ncbi:cysteine-rich receptor-like protein kinase 10 isoform X1 [Ipomoea triloba]|uniref:cysteine-rich receptor-like protein kinase 10 isoform X1 n=1 Tax=Ipomoea triloba TaxID=35885 RepID=UPI00125DC10A|nr:cysteine-rich receptor-like protein kinase 10 isoform X1 [Ipomoea triloba]